MEHFPQYKLSDFEDMGQVEYELLLARTNQMQTNAHSLAIELRKVQAYQLRTSGNEIDKDFFKDLQAPYEIPARLLTKEEYLERERAKSRNKMTRERFYKMNQNIKKDG
ncbi:hypothetical protein J4G57_05320 [Aeromonas caviae]|uniref:hypothetical protein n=1 Tax=Aeromonas TaxID=642 RepID=UPI000F77D726|nr:MULTISPECIES: hypothetical protein [Aeromonas]MBS4707313.1 hypothetical protein [Aeromonas caviae]RSM32289.1 hypothetical protein C5B78_00985 [Aeromonas salmonicida]